MALIKRWVIIATATSSNNAFDLGDEYFIVKHKGSKADMLWTQHPDSTSQKIRCGYSSRQLAEEQVKEYNEGSEKYGQPWHYKLALIAYDTGEDDVPEAQG